MLEMGNPNEVFYVTLISFCVLWIMAGCSYGLVREFRKPGSARRFVGLHYFYAVLNGLLIGLVLLLGLVSQPKFSLHEIVLPMIVFTLTLSFALSFALVAYAGYLSDRFSKTWVKALEVPRRTPTSVPCTCNCAIGVLSRGAK